MNLSSRLPITPARGNAYIFVMYDFDSNSITGVPIKTKTKQSFMQGHKYFLFDLTRAGIKPILHHLEKEVYENIIEYMIKNNTNYQIEAPGYHRLKFAEMCLQTFKNHFVSILHGCDPEYPSNQW